MKFHIHTSLNAIAWSMVWHHKVLMINSIEFPLKIQYPYMYFIGTNSKKKKKSHRIQLATMQFSMKSTNEISYRQNYVAIWCEVFAAAAATAVALLIYFYILCVFFSFSYGLIVAMIPCIMYMP